MTLLEDSTSMSKQQVGKVFNKEQFLRWLDTQEADKFITASTSDLDSKIILIESLIQALTVIQGHESTLITLTQWLTSYKELKQEPQITRVFKKCSATDRWTKTLNAGYMVELMKYTGDIRVQRRPDDHCLNLVNRFTVFV